MASSGRIIHPLVLSGTRCGFTRGPSVLAARAASTARKVFFATGYETREILPKRIVRLGTTYGLVSEPLEDLSWWEAGR
jgi:hypothetical protein